MRLIRKILAKPAAWSVLFFTAAQLITFAIISRENGFLQSIQVYVPSPPSGDGVPFWPPPPPATTTPGTPEPAPALSYLGPLLIYFFSVIIILGLILFLIPRAALRYVLRVTFAFLFAWGIFIALVCWVPVLAAVAIALAVGALWLLTPRVWRHNLVMVVAMASVGAVFGRLLSPWTAMALLGVMAIYDFFAVRFGYMMWLAGRLSESHSLPAFVIPRRVAEWRTPLTQYTVSGLAETAPAERTFSILGGGDIAFPVLLVSAVFFVYGTASAILIAGLSLAGLIAAYLVQAYLLKGKPMPGLPPMAVLCLVGMLLIR